jgi:hypothetical protein
MRRAVVLDASMKCPSCNASVPEAAKFCSECGAQLALAPSLPSPATGGGLAGGQPRFASAKDYTPKHLAKKILTSRAALEGERKQVTVLFADLKGSMELIAERDPEEAAQSSSRCSSAWWRRCITTRAP